MKPSRFAAMTFDVFGTLIDWEPTIIGYLRAWADASRVAAGGAEAAKPDLTFSSLAKLVAAHRAESADAGLRT
jgi:hypothetical protein